MAIIARSSFTVTDITDGKSISLRLSASKGTMQVASSESSYSPDWSTTPNIITPSILVGGESSTQALTTAPVWKVDTETIVAGNSNYEIGTSANGYALTVKSNLSSATAVVTCSTSYVDSSGTSTPVEASMTLVRIDSASDGYAVIPSYDSLLLDSSTSSIAITAVLYNNGVEMSAYAYAWYEFESGSWGSSTIGTNATLTVTKAMVESKSQFKCEVTPVSGYSGTKPSFIVIVDDITDEYAVYIMGNDTIKDSNPTTTLVVKLTKNGDEVSTAEYNLYTFTWYKQDEDGSVVSGWSETGTSIELGRDDVDSVNTFIVEVTE